MKYKLKVSDLVDSYWKFLGIWVLLRETNVLEAFYHPLCFPTAVSIGIRGEFR